MLVFDLFLNMEQQPPIQEYYDRSMTDAIRALDALNVGDSICFVGLRELAESLVSLAFERGYRLEGHYQEGFGQHFLILIERGKKPELVDSTDASISTWTAWFRSTIHDLVSLLWSQRLS